MLYETNFETTMWVSVSSRIFFITFPSLPMTRPQ